MRPAWLLAVVAAIVLASTPASDAGPVKHWGVFPGREVRAIALRGYELGAEPQYRMVQGRDGYVYVRGQFGLYRLLDLDGNTQRVADTSECSGWLESHGFDDRNGTPRAICSRASQIILAGSSGHVHLRTPVPDWRGSWVRDAFPQHPGYVVDDRYLTDVLPADGGGYWFSYGVVSGVGRLMPSGRAVLRNLASGELVAMVASGDDLYVASRGCSIKHLRHWYVRDVRQVPCDRYSQWQRMALASDGSVWVLGGATGVVERWGRGGSRARWKLALIPTAVAVTSDGTAYVFGFKPPDFRGHPMIATIVPGRAPRLQALPMSDFGTVAVDRRDRIWITVPDSHSLAVIAPVASTTTAANGPTSPRRSGSPRR